MAADKITCKVTFTEGATERITAAFVDLYYDILDGVYEGPLPEEKKEGEKLLLQRGGPAV